jgi:hypothetical protein
LPSVAGVCDPGALQQASDALLQGTVPSGTIPASERPATVLGRAIHSIARTSVAHGRARVNAWHDKIERPSAVIYGDYFKLAARFSWWQIWQLWLTVTVAFLETESEFAVWHSVQQFTLPRSALASTLWLVIV